MEAEKILLSGMHEVSGFHSPKWERLLEAVYIRQQLVSGVIEAGEQWQAKRHLSSTDQAHVTREYEQITLARILIAKQDFDEAMSWLNRLLSEAIRADRIGSQLEILLLLAAVNASLEDKEQSIWDCLERALGIAADEGYIRIFLDEGHPWLVYYYDGLFKYPRANKALNMPMRIISFHCSEANKASMRN